MIMTFDTTALYAWPIGAMNFGLWVNIPRNRAKMLGAPALWRPISDALFGLGQLLRYFGNLSNIQVLVIAMICIIANFYNA
jgi:hypothetical protein